MADPPPPPIQPLAPGNYDRAWNDPPLFSYNPGTAQVVKPQNQFWTKKFTSPLSQGVGVAWHDVLAFPPQAHQPHCHLEPTQQHHPVSMMLGLGHHHPCFHHPLPWWRCLLPQLLQHLNPHSTQIQSLLTILWILWMQMIWKRHWRDLLGIILTQSKQKRLGKDWMVLWLPTGQTRLLQEYPYFWPNYWPLWRMGTRQARRQASPHSVLTTVESLEMPSGWWLWGIWWVKCPKKVRERKRR